MGEERWAKFRDPFPEWVGQQDAGGYQMLGAF